MLKFKLCEYLDAKFDEIMDGSSLKAVARVANHCSIVRNKINKCLIEDQMEHFFLCLNIVQVHASGFLQNLFQPDNDFITPQWFVNDYEKEFTDDMLKEYMPRYKAYLDKEPYMKRAISKFLEGQDMKEAISYFLA